MQFDVESDRLSLRKKSFYETLVFVVLRNMV